MSAGLKYKFKSNGVNLDAEFTFPQSGGEQDFSMTIINEGRDGAPDEEVGFAEMTGAWNTPAMIEALIALGRALDREWMPRFRQPCKEELIREK